MPENNGIPFIPQKQCRRCLAAFPSTKQYFTNDARRTHGITDLCKLCTKERQQRWQAANSERIIPKNRHYQHTHLVEIRISKRLYRQDKNESIRTYFRNYRVLNRDALNTRQRARRHARIDIIHAYEKTSRQRHPEQQRLKVHRRRAILLAVPLNDFTLAQWRAVHAIAAKMLVRFRSLCNRYSCCNPYPRVWSHAYA